MANLDEVKQVADELGAKFAQFEAKHSERYDAIEKEIGAKNRPSSGGIAAKSFASTINDSEQLGLMRKGVTKSANIPMELSVKTLVNDSSATNTQFDTGAMRYDLMGNNPMRKLSLLEAIQSLKVDAGSFEFNQLTAAYSNAAAEQENQGDKKAEQVTLNELKTVKIRTVAVTEPVSEQVLQDSPSLSVFLFNRMVYNVRSKLEGLIADELVAEATAFTQSVDAATPDAISEAIAELDSKGFMPGFVVMSPAAWSKIRTERSALDGQYVAGSFANLAAPSVFGVPVITSPTMDDSTVLVVDSSQVLFLDREMAAFAFGYNADGWSRNVITARAECRGAVAVLSKGAVLKITLAA